MIRIPKNRTPTYPGTILLEEFLIPMGISQQALADRIHVPYQRINDLVHGRRSLTPSTALRLSKFFGNSVGFWMNLQLRLDLFHAAQKEDKALKSIEPYPDHLVVR